MDPPSLMLDAAASSLVTALQEYRSFGNDVRYLLEQLPSDDRDELTRTVKRIASRAATVADHARRAEESAHHQGNMGNSIQSLATQLTLHTDSDAKAARHAYVEHLGQAHGV